MAFAPYSGTGTRRVPFAIQGGTATKLCPPNLIPRRDNWSMAIVFPSGAVAAAATTFTIGTIIEAAPETGWDTTAGRLDGLLFMVKGDVYRITAQSGAGLLTFERANGDTGGVITAFGTSDEVRIQSDLPALLAKLMVNTTGTDIYYSYHRDKTVSGGEYFTIANSQADLIVDASAGGFSPAKPMFFTGLAAGTMELEVYEA